MLKNSKVVLFVTLKSWSGRKRLDHTTYLSVIITDLANIKLHNLSVQE